MLYFESSLSTLHVPRERLTKTLDRILGQIIREAAREWLRALVVEVPVQTGMAKGALQPLGRFLRVAVPIRPIRKPYYSHLEGGEQTISFGAEKTEFVIKDDKSNGGSFIYEFSWSTDVLHYWLSQYYRGKALPGDIAIQKADDAFLQHVQSTIDRRLPAILESLIEVHTEIGN